MGCHLSDNGGSMRCSMDNVAQTVEAHMARLSGNSFMRVECQARLAERTREFARRLIPRLQ